MVNNTVYIVIACRIKAFAVLIAENKFNSCVDNSLSFHYVKKIFGLNVDIRKDFEVGFPMNFCTSILFAVRLFFELADNLAFFKTESVSVAVTADINIHILGTVLG